MRCPLLTLLRGMATQYQKTMSITSNERIFCSRHVRTCPSRQIINKVCTLHTAFSQNLGSAHFFKFFLRGSQERKDLALNPKRVSLVVGKDQQRTCAVMGRKCRVKPVVPRLPGQTFHWSKSADLWVCVSLSFPGAPRKKKLKSAHCQGFVKLLYATVWLCRDLM